MNKSLHIILSILVIIILGICALCSPEQNHDSVKTTEAKTGFVFRYGEKLYANYCAPCHGETGEGDGIYFGYDLNPKPPDFTVQ